MARAVVVLLAWGMLGGGVAHAQPLPDGLEVVSAASVGLSEEGLERATAGLRSHIDSGDIAGVVAAVVRDGRLAYLQALGTRDLATGDPMPTDALFRIYSMTRPVTALGILMLHDEGSLDVNDPVQRYLPDFEVQPVLRDSGSDDPTDVRPRVGDVTIAQLLTHTSGIGSRNSGLYRDHSVHAWDQPLREVVDRAAALPLFDDPGTRFRYGLSADVLGRVIEVVSGMELEAFYRERIFGPLGMEDATFFVDADGRDRLATVYRPDAEGRLRPYEIEDVPVTERRALTSGGVGLVTSTLDLLRFGQFFLDDGIVDGRPLLGPETLRMARENGIPEALLPIGGSGYWLGSGWTLGGMAVVLDPSAYNHTVRAGEFWWDGSAGTRFWIDPGENMVTIVMAQVSPASGGGFREAFKTAVYESIEDPRSP